MNNNKNNNDTVKNNNDTVKSNNDNLKSNSSKASNMQRIRDRLALTKKAKKNQVPTHVLSSVSTVKHTPVVTTILKKSVLGQPPQEQASATQQGLIPQISHHVDADKEDSSASSEGVSKELTLTDESEETDEEATQDVRRMGRKSKRDSSTEIMLAMMKAAERRERAQEKKFQQLIQEVKSQNATIEHLRNEVHSNKGSEDGEAYLYRDNVGSIIKKDRANHETSRGEYISDTLLGENLPDSWPEYKWPKSWDGSVVLASALISLRDLQSSHFEIVRRKAAEPNPFEVILPNGLLSPEEERKRLMRKALQSALQELRGHLRTLDRGLKYTEYELLEPILEGFKGEYPHEHKAWELCLKGFVEYPVWITDHLHAARMVSPNLMKTNQDWFGVISGGEWPSSATKGFKTGLPKKKTKKPHGGNAGGSSSSAVKADKNKPPKPPKDPKEADPKEKDPKEKGN